MEQNSSEAGSSVSTSSRRASRRIICLRRIIRLEYRPGKIVVDLLNVCFSLRIFNVKYTGRPKGFII